MDLEQWPRGIRMVVRGRRTDRRLSKRGAVDEFSESSRRRLAWAYSQGPWLGMLTLTYPGAEVVPRDETKRHLHNFLLHLQKRDIPYLWIMEFQRRGQVHYHVWVGRNLSSRTDPVTEDKIRRWFPWRSLMLSWLRIIGEIDNPNARRVSLHPASYVQWDVRVGNNYAAKYADKRRQKGLPAGVVTMGRWWGRSRGLTEPVYRTHVDEGPLAIQVRRQVQRYLRHAMPSLRNVYMSPRQGIRRALDEKNMAQVYRLLVYYLGADPFEPRLSRSPDTPSQSFRSAMSLHRNRWSGCGGCEG